MSAEENVRYVATGTPTGWAAMAKTIRELDEDKVKDSKEDIDTLLVFTGLFSAVLTAFVIVSYASLSPDKQDTVIQQQDTVIQQQDTVIKLLGQIASQTHNSIVVASIMNSTVSPSHVPPSSPLPFEPSLPALRVNYLWFASLIVTLITASFSMLVKQWLREYLACDYTSPHERLRARQFRHPGLVAWKVYEIAGVLPLLLQLALGLFFLGMCFFTRSDLHGIGDMCAVLVAIWASLFVTATIAPFFSPRCPYKTPLLKKLAVHIRRLLKLIIIRSRRSLVTIIIRSRRLFITITIRSRRLLATIIVRSRRLNLEAQPVVAMPNNVSVDSEVDERMQLLYPLQPHEPQTQFIEEDEAVKMDTDELTLLEEVDAFLLDDDLLGTTIYDSLVQYNTEPSRVIEFVCQALTLRLKGEALRRPFERPSDLRRLTKRGWIAVSDIVAATVQKGLGSNIETAGLWLQDAINLLFSISEQPLTSNARKALLHCCSRPVPALPYLTHALSTSDPNPIRNGRFHGVLAGIPGCLSNQSSETVASCNHILLLVVIHLAAEMHQSVPSLPLESALDLRQVTQPTWQLCSDALAAMIANALGSNQNTEEVSPWLEDAIRILLSPSPYPLTSQATEVLASLCSSKVLHKRFKTCMHPLASPKCEYYPQVLSRLGEICSAITDNHNSIRWLLREIVYSIPCTSQCTHGSSSSLGSLIYEHTPHYLEWTKYYTSILVKRCRTIFTASGAWPAGSLSCFWALLALPDAHNLGDSDVLDLLLGLICDHIYSMGVLRSLVSVRQDVRANHVSEAAVRCIVSLISNADTKDRHQLITCLQQACDSYLDVPGNNYYSDLNPVRQFALASTIHQKVRLDIGLADVWILYYKTCAETMSKFKTIQYHRLPADEQAETARIAAECLERLDSMEPTNGDVDQWEASFDVDASIFPDNIFRELVKFVPDMDAIARRCKRVRRLQDIGLLPKTLRASHTDQPEGRYLGIDRQNIHHDEPPEVANPILATATEKAHASTDHGHPAPDANDDDQQRTPDPDVIRSENQISVSGDEPSSTRPGPSVTAAFGEVHSGATPNKDHVLLEKADSTIDTKHADEGLFHSRRIDVDAPMSSGVHDEGGAGEVTTGGHAAEVMVGAIGRGDSTVNEDQVTAPSEGRVLSVKEDLVGEGARMDDALTQGTREDLGEQPPLVLDDDGGVGRVSGVERAVRVEAGSLDGAESVVGGDLAQDVTLTEDQGGLAQSENAGLDASPPSAPNDEGEPGEGSTFDRAESVMARATGETESGTVDDPEGTAGLRHRE